MKLPYTADLNTAVKTLNQLTSVMCSAYGNDCVECEFWCDCDDYCTLKRNISAIKAIKNEFDIQSNDFRCEYCGEYVAIAHSNIKYCPYCGKYMNHFEGLHLMEDGANG